MILAVSLNSAMDRTILLARQVAPGAVQRAMSVDVQMGGKGLNVAKAAVQLGAAVCVTGFAGGQTGRYLRAECARLGIQDGLVTTAGESRVCYMFATADGTPPTVVNEPGPVITPAEAESLLETFVRLLPGASLAILSGSVPPGTPDDIYRRMIEAARRAGVRCILDSSGEPLRQGLQARPWLVKPNADEFAELTGGPWATQAELIDRCRALQADGVENVVVSLGGDGAVLVSGDGCWQITPPHLEAVNPTGCGDIFIAGLSVLIDRGGSLLDGLRFGTACAAANAARFEPYIPTPDELGPLLTGVQIRSIGGDR